MAEGEARRQDDVAGARAEAERFRVGVGGRFFRLGENCDYFFTKVFSLSVISCLYHPTVFHATQQLAIEPSDQPQNSGCYELIQRFVLRCSVRSHALLA